MSSPLVWTSRPSFSAFTSLFPEQTTNSPNIYTDASRLETNRSCSSPSPFFSAHPRHSTPSSSHWDYCTWPGWSSQVEKQMYNGPIWKRSIREMVLQTKLARQGQGLLFLLFPHNLSSRKRNCQVNCGRAQLRGEAKWRSFVVASPGYCTGRKNAD